MAIYSKHSQMHYVFFLISHTTIATFSKYIIYLFIAWLILPLPSALDGV